MSVRRSSAVLVGREDELRALEAAVADRGSRPVVLLGGEAGVGKTRLVAELAARARRSGALAVVGSCVQLGADGLPYAPFVDALERYVEALGDAAGDVLGAARPELAVLVSEVPAGAAAVAEASRGRVYEAVRDLLDRAPDGLLFVLEDVHWADRSSLELLTYLASRLRHGRTCLVATFRTDELHRRHPLVPILAELARSGRTTRLDLGRLGSADVAALVREIRGDVPDDLVAAIGGRSEGNPFLVEELLALDTGPSAPLPDTLRDLLLAKLASLSEPARRALAIIAAVGRPADAELVEATWDGPSDDLHLGLREAVDGAILAVEPSSGRFAFRHALIGEAVADDLLPGERVRLHAALARVLAARPDLAGPTRAGAAIEVAHHLFEARDLAAALTASVAAAEAAAAARAYPEAARLYERAIDLLERVPDASDDRTIERIGLLDAAAESSFHAGDVSRSVALGRRAVADGEGVVDDRRMSHLLCRLLEWVELTGDLEELTALGERAVGLVPPDPPSPERAFALLSLGSARMHAGRSRASLELARESARVAAACGATGKEAIARSLVAVALLALGHDREAIGEIEAAVALAEASRGPAEVGVAHIDRAGVYSVAGRFSELPAVLSAARQALDREGLHDMSEPFLATDDVELLVATDRWPEAEELASRMIEGRPPRAALANHLDVRGQLRVRTGRVEDGERDLRAIADIRPPVEAEMRARALAHLAEAALLRSDARDALALVSAALDALATTDEVPARAHLYALGLEAAADLAEWSRARRDASGEAEAEAAARPHLAGLRAAQEGTIEEGAATDGRIGARVEWGLCEDGRLAGRRDPDGWRAAAASLAGVGESYLSARMLFREAEAAVAGPADRGRAERLLREALAWATSVGAEPLRREIESLARRARLDVASPEQEATNAPGDRQVPAPTDPYGLSPRELDVLALLVEGRTNREIGADLFISEKTASVHVTHIMDKLGVTSRGAAAAVAARGRLVPLGEDPPGR